MNLEMRQRRRSRATMGWLDEKKDDSSGLPMRTKEYDRIASRKGKGFNFRTIGLKKKTKKLRATSLATALCCLGFGAYWHGRAITQNRQIYRYDYPRVLCFDDSWARLDASFKEIDEVMLHIQRRTESDDSAGSDDSGSRSGDSSSGSGDGGDESNGAAEDWAEEWTEEPQECIYTSELPPFELLNICNGVHELDLVPSSTSSENTDFTYIHSGGQRAAYRISQEGAHFVVKTLRADKDYFLSRYGSALLDASIMERMSASPYVADIYVACGTTQVMEYSDEGNLHSLLARQRRQKKGGDENYAMSSIDKLRIAYQISTGLADVQDFLGVAHNDICCHQYLNVDGVYKLNDFHQAHYMQRNTTTYSPDNAVDQNEFCTEWSVYNEEQLKMYPPELVYDEGGYLDMSKIDTYMMTNTIYFVLSNKWMYEGLTRDETRDKLLHGKFADIPAEYLEETEDRAIVALVKAIKSGWNHDPHQRHTARQISNFLKETLVELDGGLDEEGIVRVEIPSNLMRKNDAYDVNDEEEFWRDLTLGW